MKERIRIKMMRNKSDSEAGRKPLGSPVFISVCRWNKERRGGAEVVQVVPPPVQIKETTKVTSD